MRVVMSKNEHTINVANKLINALARHCLWVRAAKIEAVFVIYPRA